MGRQMAGFGILCLALPLLRDVIVLPHPGSAMGVAAIGYGALLFAALITMRLTGVTLAEAGVRAPSAPSVLLGVTAGILLVVPVWRMAAISTSRFSWVLVAVVVEEIAFRGVLFTLLRRAGGLPLAIAGSVAVFTVAHAASAPWPSLVLVALAGLYLGLLRAIRGDLWASGFAHLIIDLVSLP